MNSDPQAWKEMWGKKKKAIYFTAVIPAIVNQSVTSLSSISAAVSSWSLASSRLPSAR